MDNLFHEHDLYDKDEHVGVCPLVRKSMLLYEGT